MKYELKHRLPDVKKDRECLSGGNQAWLPWAYMRKGGCGTIAGTDLLLYMNLFRRSCRTSFFENVPVTSEELKFDEYCDLIDRMRRTYFPIIPFLGMSGWSLALGLNLYFLRYRLPYRAHWAVRPKLLWKCVEGMLKADIPVPLAIGQNIPFFFLKHKVNFYERRANGSLFVSRRVKAHFVTITGIDEEWIRITSWGKEFWIFKEDYEAYVKKHSSPLVSNIVTIGRR